MSVSTSYQYSFKSIFIRCRTTVCVCVCAFTNLLNDLHVCVVLDITFAYHCRHYTIYNVL